MLEGIDTASNIESHAAALRAAGAHFACRYIAPPGAAFDWKRLTRSEAQAIITAGLALVVVFESGGQRALTGHAGGVQDANAAEAALADLRLDGSPVYFAVDFDLRGSDVPAVVAYMTGAASILGKARTGVYGGLRAVSAVMDARAVGYAWQTYGWSGTPTLWDRRSHLRQYKNGQQLAGVAVDLDHALADDYGQHKTKATLAGWTVSFISRGGEPAQQNLGLKTRLGARQPDAWVKRHHTAFQRGRVTITRRMKG
jgi:hypothetical protein